VNRKNFQWIHFLVYFSIACDAAVWAIVDMH